MLDNMPCESLVPKGFQPRNFPDHFLKKYSYFKITSKRCSHFALGFIAFVNEYFAKSTVHV
ncbi:hypothetical protein SAMN04488505_10860 [Chitinophaga rupis]|uniref:Uncharacterized protein n=1 Tax=Chitinophaga rupis TaxID=573321 RepID=A0A1H8DP73_9BACT|nr:hypothetical protein SAMN04488505_10860 [Chitinophaga rupis]